MKKYFSLFILTSLLATGAFAGSTTIQLTAPVVTSLKVGTTTYPIASTDPLNQGIQSAFTTIQNNLNNGPLAQLHDLSQLSQGFANANMASFDNASLLGYQTYDLFAVMLGFNLGLAVPSFDPSGATAAINNITTTGDIYAGAATSGFAGQFGINLGFLVPNLYGTVKAGFVPSAPINGATYQQGMFGLGVNYTLIPQYDFLSGLMKWRGVSVGSGFTFNGNSTTVDVPISDPTPQSFGPVSTAAGSVSGTVSATNVKAKLSVNNSSFVIPIDVMTSIQALWFLNFGLGLGADLSFSSAQIKLAGTSDLGLALANSTTTAVTTPGSATLTATDSNGNGAILVPRLAASIGVDLTIFKLDVPMSFYPTTKAFAIGFSAGAVW